LMGLSFVTLGGIGGFKLKGTKVDRVLRTLATTYLKGKP